MKRKKKKKNNLITFISILVVISIGVYLIYNNLDKKNNKPDNKTSDKTEIKEESNTKKEETNNKKEETIPEEEQKQEQKEEKPEEYEFNTQEGEEVKVDANKMVEATGFSGASNYKFYLRGTTLYFKDVSISETEEEILAYNVKDLYLKNKRVTAELYSDGKIVKENNYITYK